MEWVTTTAKTLPEAIDLALDNLGVDESEAEIVVLEEPSKGLFGRIRGSARVEARVKPRPIRPKNDRNRGRKSRSNDKGRNRGGRGRGGDNRGGDGRGGKKSSSHRDAGNGRRDDRNRNRSKIDGKQASGNGRARGGKKGGKTPDADRADDKVKAESGKRSGGGNGRRGGGDRSSTAQNGRSKTSNKRQGKTNSTSPSDRKSTTTQEETPMEEVAEHLRDFLGGLTEAFGLDGEVVIDDVEPNVLVATVQGQHGLMVGPKGRTLDAIQELARVSSQRAAPSSVRIRVDVGGYRTQRAAALGDFAQKAADKAIDNGCEIKMEPMSPADRKAVHDALVEDDRVETRSVGTEPRRRVIVIPLDGGSVSNNGSADDEEE